ncbi:MAG TPA: FtsX-like permease family protein [Bryobacteraceae bacterium]
MADHLRDLSGVQAVAYADWPILDGRSFKSNAISVEGAPSSKISAWFLNVSPGWFAAMEIPLLAGRDFNRADSSPGVAVVNEVFAQQFFGKGNPLGKWFAGTSGWMRGQKFQIIGLVGNARYRYLRQPVLPVAYTPFRRIDAKGAMGGGTFVVRTTASNPLTLSSALHNEIPHSRPEFRVSNMRTQQDLIEAQTIRERLLAMLARFFGAIALLLAGVGLYGVLDYSVFQRRREIGIRMAVGAEPQELAVQVTARFFWMLLVGAITGFACSLASVRYIESLLYQVRPIAVPVLLIPVIAMLAAAVIAAVPAVIHAIKIDVATLLRAE